MEAGLHLDDTGMKAPDRRIEAEGLAPDHLRVP